MYNPNVGTSNKASNVAPGPPGAQPMTIEHLLSAIERPYYTNLFSQVSMDSQYTDDRLIEMLKKTNLSNPQLKEIWIKYANNSNRITKLQFFTMMRAVALMQNGPIEDIDQYLLARNFPYLAKIAGVQTPAMPSNIQPNANHMNVAFAPIKEEDQLFYEDLIDRSHTNVKGLLRAGEAKNILLQSGLDQSQLKQIWELCDKSEEGTQPGSGKGFLKRNEWILCLHLITYTKKGWPLPKILPPELFSFLANYSQLRMQSEQGFGSNSYINLGNSQGSFSQSYSLNQPATPSYQQSTVLNDLSQVQRANTAPAMPQGTSLGSNPSLPNSQVFKNTAAQSGDITALTSLLERVIKGYDLLAKKYSDETDSFMETFTKLSDEKQNILNEISNEIEMLSKEIEDSTTVKASIVTEAQSAVARSKDSTLSDKLTKLSQTLSNDQNLNETHDVLKLLKARLEGGVFPIRLEPLPQLTDVKANALPAQSFIGSAVQPKSPHAQPQSTLQFQGREQPKIEEEDMFA